MLEFYDGREGSKMEWLFVFKIKQEMLVVIPNWMLPKLQLKKFFSTNSSLLKIPSSFSLIYDITKQPI